MEVRRSPRTDCSKGDRETILAGRRVDDDPEPVEFRFGLLPDATVFTDEQHRGLRCRVASADQPINQSTDPLASRDTRQSMIDKPDNAPSVVGKLDAAIERAVDRFNRL
jgi:hypothetical protein